MLPSDLQAMESKLRNLQNEEEAASQKAEYERAAELRAERIRLQDEFDSIRPDVPRESEAEMVVSAEDIGKLIATWTGIPVDRLLESEADKLLQMEERIHERVIGQESAITAISDAVRRARAGLKDPKRPIGSFIFLGPTGVGKTELARALAGYLFDDDQPLHRRTACLIRDWVCAIISATTAGEC